MPSNPAWHAHRFERGLCARCMDAREKPYTLCRRHRLKHRGFSQATRIRQLTRRGPFALPFPAIKPHVPTPHAHDVRSLTYLPAPGAIVQQFFGRVIPALR